MATIPFDPQARSVPSRDGSIEEMLCALEEAVINAPDLLTDSTYFRSLGDELRRLHARLRIHHAAGFRGEEMEAAIVALPALTETLQRLKEERPLILGTIDRLIRASDSIADQEVETRDVFILRIRELIAMLRRHHAEEDRLLFLATWHDIGGES
jgi:hypothetical protein